MNFNGRKCAYYSSTEHLKKKNQYPNPLGLESIGVSMQCTALCRDDEICLLVQFKIWENIVKIHVHGPLLLCKLAQNPLNVVSPCRTFNYL